MVVPKAACYPSGKLTVMVKTVEKVCPVCESRLPKPPERRNQQYIVSDRNPAECELRDVILSLSRQLVSIYPSSIFS